MSFIVAQLFPQLKTGFATELAALDSTVLLSVSETACIAFFKEAAGALSWSKEHKDGQKSAPAFDVCSGLKGVFHCCRGLQADRQDTRRLSESFMTQRRGVEVVMRRSSAQISSSQVCRVDTLMQVQSL